MMRLRWWRWRRQPAEPSRTTRADLFGAWTREGFPAGYDMALEFDTDDHLVQMTAELNRASNRPSTLTINGERTTWPAEYRRVMSR